MTIPLAIVSGPAGSGKDTVASFAIRNHRAIGIAQAAPMKRFQKKVFGFTDQQLWGPSEYRNAPDSRNTKQDWDKYAYEFYDLYEGEVVHLGLSQKAELSMCKWFDGLRSYCKTNDFSPRTALQTYGTEFGRSQKKNLWINYAIRTAKKILSGGWDYTEQHGLIELTDPNRVAAEWVFVTDGRFPNEIMAVKQAGGTAIQVVGATQTLTAGVVGHTSESAIQQIPSGWWDIIFHNEKSLGLGACEKQVARMVQVLNHKVELSPC